MVAILAILGAGSYMASISSPSPLVSVAALSSVFPMFGVRVRLVVMGITVGLLLRFRLFFAAVAGPLRVPVLEELVGFAAASFAASVDMVGELGEGLIWCVA